MSDVMNDHALRSASGRIPGPGLSGREHRGPRRSSRGTRIVRAYARVHEGPRRDGTTVRSDLRSSRARASNSHVKFSPSRGYVRTDTTTIVSGDVRFALATPSAIIHVTYCNCYRNLHQRKSPGESRLLALSYTGIFRLPNERVENVQLE